MKYSVSVVFLPLFINFLLPKQEALKLLASPWLLFSAELVVKRVFLRLSWTFFVQGQMELFIELQNEKRFELPICIINVFRRADGRIESRGSEEEAWVDF